MPVKKATPYEQILRMGILDIMVKRCFYVNTIFEFWKRKNLSFYLFLRIIVRTEGAIKTIPCFSDTAHLFFIDKSDSG